MDENNYSHIMFFIAPEIIVVYNNRGVYDQISCMEFASDKARVRLGAIH